MIATQAGSSATAVTIDGVAANDGGKSMLARLAGVVTLVAALAIGLLAVPALAVEEGEPEGHGPLPELGEIGTQSDVAKDYFPEEAEEPVFADFLIYPLLALGLVVSLVVLTLYLRWQPTFAEERHKARR
jgi:hypothetical protein